MRKLLAILSLFTLASSALAANPTCPTRAIGDSSNACASTAFVQVNGGFSHISGDCTATSLGVITCTKTNGTPFGTMATQNASSVAITGGTITGMPTPTNSSDVANKSYVDSIAVGITPLPLSTLATAAALPNSPTYNNGTLGVGATLTAGSNSTLTVDGTSALLNTIVLVKNQASPEQNGIYSVTTAGSGAAPWVLTRVTYFDQAAEMKANSSTFITNGATNFNSTYALQTTITTVGTDPLNFITISTINFITSGSVITTAPFTGAVARTQLAKNTETSISVADFGAVCDGVTDDFAAITAAIAATPSGGRLLFPGGCLAKYPGSGTSLFHRTTPITFMGINQQYSGIFVDSTVPLTVDVIFIQPFPFIQSAAFAFENMFITSITGLAAGRDMVRFDFTSSATTEIGQIYFHRTLINSLQAGAYAIHFVNVLANFQGGVYDTTIDNNVLLGGIRFDNSGDSLRVTNNTLSGHNAAVSGNQVPGAAGMLISGNNITSDGGALSLSCSAYLRFVNNEIEQTVLSTNIHTTMLDFVNGGPCANNNPVIEGNSLNFQAGAGNGPWMRFESSTTNPMVERNALTNVGYSAGIVNYSSTLVCGFNVFNDGQSAGNHIGPTQPTANNNYGHC